MGHELNHHICDIEDILIDQAYEHMQNPEMVNTHEMGEVIDMIKDIAEIKRNHHEACYYESVVEAMKNSSNDVDVESLVDSIKTLWLDADYDHKQKIKNNITGLMSEMA